MVSQGLQGSGQFLQLEVQQGAVGGLRVVLLDYGEDVEGEPAGECKGELVKRRQAGHDIVATMAWPNSISASLSVLCSSTSETESETR